MRPIFRRAPSASDRRERPGGSERERLPVRSLRMAEPWFDWNRDVVLSAAAAIDADSERVMDWFVHDRIREFGQRTAQQLVLSGETARVLDMLHAIRRGLRDR